MTLSVRWKVTLGTLIAVTFGLAIAGWLVIRSIEGIELARLTDSLEAQTRLAALSLHPSFAPDRPSPGAGALQERARDIGGRAGVRVTLVDEHGTVLADSAVADDEVARIENHGSRPEIRQALTGGRGTDIRSSHTTGQRTLYVAVPLDRLPAGGTSGAMLLRLGFPLDALDRQIRGLERTLFLAFASAFAVAAVLGTLIARGVTKPLSDMATVARQLAAGVPGIRVRTSSRDEVGLLGETLNHMTDQLSAKIRELSEDRAQLLAMLTSMVEGVMVLDYRGTVLQVNPALERMFGLSAAEARGGSYLEVIRHEQLAELVSNVLRSRSGRGEEIQLPSHGRCLHVEASMAGGQRENEACVVLVVHDITELRRLEKIRKDFVANVSHELRTPLTSIKGYVEALLDGAKDDPEMSTRFLDIILKQSDRLNLILEDLLQLSRIESGQVLLKQDPLDIRTLVERTLPMIKPLADKKGHQLRVEIPADLPPILGDEERLVQVLTNLLDNAVKYTPAQGIITVAARPAGDRGGTAPAAVELSVSDTGLGIPEADRPRVFERFYRVDKARSRELGGTGLGLAIVKHIAEAHGGQVWVEGNQPAGSRFVVLLPIAEARHPAGQPSLLPST